VQALCYASNVNHSRPIALVGLMGAGKSAVAKVLGARLAIAVADLDARIEAEAGRTVAELFADDGEAAFRVRETRALERAIEEEVGVIACGGGVVLDEGNRARLSTRCRTVWLDVDPDVAARRVSGTPRLRPLLGEGPLAPRLERLLAERAAAYAVVACARVDTTDHDPEAAATLVLSCLEEPAR
jgi:shikimate kinase